MAKNEWIQKVVKRMEQKGTKGAFTEWCKSQGYSGVTWECIRKGKRSSSAIIRKRATLAETFRKIAMRRKRK